MRESCLVRARYKHCVFRVFAPHQMYVHVRFIKIVNELRLTVSTSCLLCGTNLGNAVKCRLRLIQVCNKIFSDGFLFRERVGRHVFMAKK
jgi:hypothetical protein